MCRETIKHISPVSCCVLVLLQAVVHTIELQDTNDRNLPYTECVIVNSGRIPVKEPFVVEVEGW